MNNRLDRLSSKPSVIVPDGDHSICCSLRAVCAQKQTRRYLESHRHSLCSRAVSFTRTRDRQATRPHLTASHVATRDSTISRCPTQNEGRNSFISSAQRFVNNKPRPGNTRMGTSPKRPRPLLVPWPQVRQNAGCRKSSPEWKKYHRRPHIAISGGARLCGSGPGSCGAAASQRWENAP